MIMKRILTIQDISCLGKCSLTIALPVLSAMGIEAVILPTALLSTHTMFKGFTVKDLSDQLIPITEHWKKEKVHFDGIYTGYLGTEEEIGICEGIFRDFGGEGCLKFIDPVMADNGKLYPAFDLAYAKRNAAFCGCADIIVPNLTEACFMTDSEYRTEYDRDYLKDILKKLTALGAKKAVLTGACLEPGKTGVFGLDAETGEYFSYQHKRIDAAYHGTGDLFSSVSAGGLILGMSQEDAFALAADYTQLTIEETLKNPEKPWYGVDFEATLPWLTDKLK